jgi:hypothetical protein
MLSPWDDQEQANQIQVIRDEGEHIVVGISVTTPRDADSDDCRFGLEFRTAGGRTLRLRLPVEQLAALGHVLLDLAELRRQVS